MSVLRRNLVYYSGFNASYSFTLLNEDGSPRVITESEVLGVFMKSPTSNDVTQDIYTPANYTFDITIDGNVITAALDGQFIEEGKYIFFIKETPSEILLVSGILNVLPGWIKEQ